MGLCKCPKKNMTSLFCFKHRVNVCDHCLVESHSSCVVQTYLQWLSDSDYDPNCSLCSTPLSEGGPTVRLQCLHVFHWGCVDEMARRLPANTAPAGYRCPQCREMLFPASNQASLMIERLRATLSQANWARAGLGLPILPEFELPAAPRPVPVPPTTHARPSIPASSTPSSNFRSTTPATVLNMDEEISYAPATVSQSEANAFVRKKQFGEERPSSDSQPLLSRDADSETNKYKRRPMMTWMGGLWRAKYGNNSAKPITGWRRSLVVLFLLFLVGGTVFVLFGRFASPDDSDPMFDPLANPNIRVAEEESRMFH